MKKLIVLVFVVGAALQIDQPVTAQAQVQPTEAQAAPEAKAQPPSQSPSQLAPEQSVKDAIPTVKDAIPRDNNAVSWRANAWGLDGKETPYRFVGIPIGVPPYRFEMEFEPVSPLRKGAVVLRENKLFLLNLTDEEKIEEIEITKVTLSRTSWFRRVTEEIWIFPWKGRIIRIWVQRGVLEIGSFKDGLLIRGNVYYFD
ncbi:MAG: hypothetical protein ABIK73_08445 [candidate division WOR-3 bacterium]